MTSQNKALMFVLIYILFFVAISQVKGKEVYIREVQGTPPQEEFVTLESFTAEVTSYSEIDSCHYEGCIMASGKRAYIGAIACPRRIKLYTRVIIDDTLYICEDRTNKSLDGRFDIFNGYGQTSYEKAITFGKQKKNVQILQ